MFRRAGECAAVIVKRVEAALKAVIQNAHQRIIAKADRLIPAIAQRFCQMG